MRIWNASYLNYDQAKYWSSKNRESTEKMLEAIEAGVEIIFTDVSTTDQAVKNVGESKKNYTDLEKSFSLKSKFWIKASNLAQASVYVGAVSGLIFLSVFLIIVTYRLVYS